MKRKRIIIIVLIVVLLMIAALVGVFANKQNNQETGMENREQKIAELDNGLELLDMYNTSGTFMEDGSDMNVEDIAVAVIKNTSEKALQLAEIHINLDGEVYDFQITTLPAGEKVMVQELNKKQLPDNYTDISMTEENVVFFTEELSLYEDTFKITSEERSITLKNISSETIKGPIYVYYKLVGENGYMGGITYRVGFSNLEAGESESLNAGHFNPEICEIMFINYAQ